MVSRGLLLLFSGVKIAGMGVIVDGFGFGGEGEDVTSGLCSVLDAMGVGDGLGGLSDVMSVAAAAFVCVSESGFGFNCDCD